MSSELNDWVIPKTSNTGEILEEVSCQFSAAQASPPVAGAVPANWSLGSVVNSSDNIVGHTHQNHVPAGIYVVEFDYYNTNETVQHMYNGQSVDLLFGEVHPNTPNLNSLYGFKHPLRAFNVIRVNESSHVAIRYTGLGGSDTFQIKNLLVYKVAEVDGTRRPLKTFSDYKYQFNGYRDTLFHRGVSIDSGNVSTLHSSNFNAGWTSFLGYPSISATTHPEDLVNRNEAPSGIYHAATFASWGLNNTILRNFYTDSKILEDIGTNTPETVPQDYLSSILPNANIGGKVTHLIRRFSTNVGKDTFFYPSNNIYEGEYNTPWLGSQPSFEGYRVRLSSGDLGNNPATVSFGFGYHPTETPYIVQSIMLGTSNSLFGGFIAERGAKGFIRLINEGGSLMSGTGVVEFFIGQQSLGFFGRGIGGMVFVTDANMQNNGLQIICHGSGNLIGLDFEIVYL